MAAMAGLLNHQMTAGQALTGKGATPMASTTTGTSSTSSSGSSSATISANDFLTLLVTEMQNQDPTADTDPNEYINQLVQVNSLEQLISINQTLSTDLGSPATGSSGGATSGQVGASTSGLAGASPASATAQVRAAGHKPGGMTAAQPGGSSTAAAINQFAQSVGAKRAPGNLSVPEAKPSAHRVAHALDGRSHAQPLSGGLPGAQ
jgi:flagellar basal-body rod modification protein FlgD